MNIKKTSVITLIALLSCDTFAASSIVRAGVTPLGQATGVRATPSAGNSTNRASLGIGSYYDINKLRPNRTQTSAGGSTGGSTGGSSNNVSNSALESVRQELTQELTEVKTTLTKQISDLVKLVEAKDAEIQNLKDDLADATLEIEQIADKKYVTESDLGARFNNIKDEAVSRAISAVKNSSYATGSYVDQEINDLRSEITSAREAALKPYAKTETVNADIAKAKTEAVETAAKNATAQGYISATTVQQDIKDAKDAAIKDALAQAEQAVQNTLATYATTKALTDLETTITAARNTALQNYATTKALTDLETTITTARTDALKNYATTKALTDLETTITTARTDDLKNYATNTALTNLETTITTARNTALQAYATKDYVDTATTDLTNNGDVTSAVANLKSEITAAREAALQNYATTTALTNLKNEITSDRNEALESYAKTDTVNADIATAKQDAITEAVAQVETLNYATNKRVNNLNKGVTDSIADLQTKITAADGELGTLKQQLGTATQNALTAEAVKGQIETALSEGKYITQSELDDSADGITQSISALNAKFTTQDELNKTFAAASVITQIQSDIIELSEEVAANTTGLETKQNALDSLNTELGKAQADITKLTTDVSGTITLANVNTAIETALATKTYATSADLDQRVSDIQGWVYAQGYATSADVGTDITSVRTDIDNKLEGYAKAETVNSLKTQLDTTDENIKNLTERTDKLASDAEDYVTNDDLNAKLGNYAKTESQGQYVTRAEIETAFKVPYGANNEPKPLVTNTNGKLTFNKDSFDAAVLTNLDDYVTNNALDGKLGNYAKTESLDEYVTREEIENAFTVPYGANNNTKPLIVPDSDGKLTFDKDSFESAVTGVTDVANMRGLYNWFVGKDTTDGGWFKQEGNVFTLKTGADEGIAKSIAGLKEVNKATSLFVRTSALNDYATKDYVTTEVKNWSSSEKMPENWQKSIFDVLVINNTKPLVRKDDDGKWTFQVNEFNEAVQTNLTGYVTDNKLASKLVPYAQTTYIENNYATKETVTHLEEDLKDYIKTDELADTILNSYEIVNKLPYVTTEKFNNTIAGINIPEVNSLNSRVTALEAYKEGNISIVAGELIKNDAFMQTIVDGLSSKDIEFPAFVTPESLAETLGDYAKTKYVNDALKSLGDTLVVPDGSEDNNVTKPLIIYDGDGTWTYNSKDFDQAVIGVTDVANMQGLYNWLVGTGTDDGGWFKKTDDVFALNTGADEGIAKSIAGLKKGDNPLFVQTSALTEYAKKSDIPAGDGNDMSEYAKTADVAATYATKEEMKKGLKNLGGALVIPNGEGAETKPLIKFEDKDGELTFEKTDFDQAVLANLGGYATTSDLADYATKEELKKGLKNLGGALVIPNGEGAETKPLIKFEDKDGELTFEKTDFDQAVIGVTDVANMQGLYNWLVGSGSGTNTWFKKTGDGFELNAGAEEGFAKSIAGLKKGDNPLFVQTSALTEYAKKSDIPAGDGNDMSEYAKTADVAATYATKEEMKKGLKNLGGALVIPDGSEDNNVTKPLIKYNETDGELTFEKTNFDQAVIGVTDVANMQVLYKWFVGNGTDTNTWFKKEGDGLVLNAGADQGFAKSVVGVDLSENTTIKDLDDTYATKDELKDVSGTGGGTGGGDYPTRTEMDEALTNLGAALKVPYGSGTATKPLIKYEGEGQWAYDSQDFNAAVLANLGGYATTSDLADYATKEELKKGLKNLGGALVIPDGSEDNNVTKPLIKYNETDGELTFEKTNFDQAVIGVTDVANMQGLYNWLVGSGSGTNTWFKKTGGVFELNAGAEEGFAKSINDVDLSENTTIKDLDDTYATKTDFDNLAKKLKPIEEWVKTTDSGDSYEFNDRELATKIAGLKMSDYDADAEAGDELLFVKNDVLADYALTSTLEADYATKTQFNNLNTELASLKTNVNNQATRVANLENTYVTKAGLKTTLTGEKGEQPPLLLAMLTEAAGGDGEKKGALLLRALTTEIVAADDTKQPLLSNALVFKKEGEKEPLVLKLQTDEGKQMLASQAEVSSTYALTSTVTGLQNKVNTLDGEYDTLNTTVGTLGSDYTTLNGKYDALSLAAVTEDELTGVLYNKLTSPGTCSEEFVNLKALLQGEGEFGTCSEPKPAPEQTEP